MILALIALSGPLNFSSGEALIREVDRKLVRVHSLRVESDEVSSGTIYRFTIWTLSGGYGKTVSSDEIDIQNPNGGWIIHTADKTYEHLKKGEMTISPFPWTRWGKPSELIYGKVIEDRGVYRTSILKKGEDTRLELDFDRNTYLPRAVRIFVGKMPEIEKSHTTFRNFVLNPPLTKDDFEYRVSNSAHEVVSGLSQTILPAGTTAPDFRMKFISGQEKTLAECLQGQKAVLLSFWFYGCGPCRAELPTLVRLHREFASQGLKVVSVDGVDNAKIIRTFYASRGVPFDAAVGSSDPKALEAYKFGPCPMTVLIDPSGKIVYSATGFDEGKTYGVLVSELAKLGIHAP